MLLRRKRLGGAEVRVRDGGLLLRQYFFRDAGNLLGIDVALHAQHHIGRRVEDLVAVIEGLRGDLRDALHRTGDAVADGVMGIEHFQQIVVNPHTGVILAHADLLRDDALLLLHGLIGKIRGGDKVQQHPQIFLKALGALEVVAGDARGGKGVGVGPVCRENVQRVVAVRQVEHLMFQIVGHARRGVERPPVHSKAAAGSAVIRGEGGVEGGKILLRHHADLQSVVQYGGVQRLADAGIIMLVYCHLPFPLLRRSLPRPRRAGSRQDPALRCAQPS